MTGNTPRPKSWLGSTGKAALGIRLLNEQKLRNLTELQMLARVKGTCISSNLAPWAVYALHHPFSRAQCLNGCSHPFHGAKPRTVFMAFGFGPSPELVH